MSRWNGIDLHAAWAVCRQRDGLMGLGRDYNGGGPGGGNGSNGRSGGHGGAAGGGRAGGLQRPTSPFLHSSLRYDAARVCESAHFGEVASLRTVLRVHMCLLCCDAAGAHGLGGDDVELACFKIKYPTTYVGRTVGQDGRDSINLVNLTQTPSYWVLQRQYESWGATEL